MTGILRNSWRLSVDGGKHLQSLDERAIKKKRRLKQVISKRRQKLAKKIKPKTEKLTVSCHPQSQKYQVIAGLSNIIYFCLLFVRYGG